MIPMLSRSKLRFKFMSESDAFISMFPVFVSLACSLFFSVGSSSTHHYGTVVWTFDSLAKFVNFSKFVKSTRQQVEKNLYCEIAKIKSTYSLNRNELSSMKIFFFCILARFAKRGIIIWNGFMGFIGKSPNLENTRETFCKWANVYKLTCCKFIKDKANKWIAYTASKLGYN